jgi:hypothetical protein
MPLCSVVIHWCKGSKPWFVAFVAILLTLGTLRWRAVSDLLPYDQHVDETFITQRAWTILRTGDWNPHFFRYPSLPIYLTAGAMKIGGELQAPQQPVPDWKVPKHGGIYRPSWIYAAPRMIFAFSSIATLGFIGLIARKLYRSNLALLLAPLILASSAVFRTSSVRYLNVDVITVFFVCAALWVAFQWWKEDSFLLQSVVPGVLAGMAVASKYNSGLVLVPLVLRILFVNGQQRWAKLATLGGCAAAAFFSCVPYSVLDASTFWADVVWEINHYQKGHRHFDGDPGLPQLLFYLRKLAHDFGAPLLTLSGLGIVSGLLVARARTLALLSLPLLMLLHMSTNRVHFLRTVLPVFALLPVFAAGGLAMLGRLLLPAYWRRYAHPVWRPLPIHVPRFMTHKLWPRATAIGVGLLYLNVADSAFLRDATVPPETRNSIVRWLRDNANGAHIIVPPEAGLNQSVMQGTHRVKAKSGLSDLQARIEETGSSECYVVVPRYGRSKRSKALSKALVSWNSRVVFKVDGEKLRMPKNKAQSVRTKPNPALSIHFIEDCGAKS